MIAHSFEQKIQSLELLQTLFSDGLKRSQILKLELPEKELNHIIVRVHRNQPFEYIASVINPFLYFSNFQAEFIYSDYDDTLNFNLDKSANMELIWLDYSRYKLQVIDLVQWLCERLVLLRERSSSPILVAASTELTEQAQLLNQELANQLSCIPDVYILPMQQVSQQLGTHFFDNRFQQLGATKLSERANIQLAKKFGFQWLPAILKPRIKAIVYDLDNTLWSGVLGEDGQQGVRITDEHKKLHYQAKSLAKNGLFIALLSRNEKQDVDKALQAGLLGDLTNFITTQSISWQSKAEGMQQIAETLRISYNSILFVDDNIGELATVANHCSQISLLHAQSAYETYQALRFYPGIFSFGTDSSAAIRAQDLQYNQERAKLQTQAVSQEDYLASLQLELTLTHTIESTEERTVQLSNKTNQFNLNLQRYSQVDISRFLTDPNHALVLAGLSDRFSDSGIILLLVAEMENKKVIIKELCVSCRALGRGIENALIIASINKALQKLAMNNEQQDIVFQYKQGERNAPARGWLEQFTQQKLEATGSVLVSWNQQEREKYLSLLPIKIKED